MSDIEVTMDCDKCKAYQFEQGKKAMHREMRNNSLTYRCAYNQAIEDFIDKISTETEWRTESTAWNDVVRIAEQLKEQNGTVN